VGAGDDGCACSSARGGGRPFGALLWLLPLVIVRSRRRADRQSRG